MKKHSIVIVGIIVFILLLSFGSILFSKLFGMNYLSGKINNYNNYGIRITKALVSDKSDVNDVKVFISKDKKSLLVSISSMKKLNSMVLIPITIKNQGLKKVKLVDMDESIISKDYNIKITYLGLQEIKNKNIMPNDSKRIIIKVNNNQEKISKNIKISIKLKY